jgi:hypothetical protein
VLLVLCRPRQIGATCRGAGTVSRVTWPAIKHFYFHWYHLLLTHTLVSSGAYLCSGVAVAAVIVWGPGNSWHRVRNIVTWAHEGSHALAALLLSAEVRGMRLNRDTSGETYCALPRERGLLGRTTSAVVSYTGTPGPMILGAAVAMALLHGYPRLAIGPLLLITLLTIPLIRNWWGLFVLLALTGIFFGSWFVPVSLQASLLSLLVGILSLGGLKTVAESNAARKIKKSTTDAENVTRCLLVPSLIVELSWIAIWVISVVTVAILK